MQLKEKKQIAMFWILIVIAFAIMAIREGRKEKRNPGYRSWMTDDDVKTFHGPDHFNHCNKR